MWRANEGKWSDRPFDLLQAEAERLASIWEPSPKERADIIRRPRPEALAELEPIAAAQRLHASRRFSRDAASTYDGFHPRHYFMLCVRSLGLFYH